MSASVSGDKKKFTIAELASHCFFTGYTIGIHSVSVLLLPPPLLPVFYLSPFCTVAERYIPDGWLRLNNTGACQKLKFPLVAGKKLPLLAVPWNLWVLYQ